MIFRPKKVHGGYFSKIKGYSNVCWCLGRVNGGIDYCYTHTPTYKCRLSRVYPFRYHISRKVPYRLSTRNVTMKDMLDFYDFRKFCDLFRESITPVSEWRLN